MVYNLFMFIVFVHMILSWSMVIINFPIILKYAFVFLN